MNLGPLQFGAPLALLGLLVLPLIWWLLRATPPRPQTIALPSLRLLEGVEETDTTPARTPWYVIVLRLLLAGLAILGLSLPVWSPQAARTGEADAGPLLIIIDDGWASAPRWNEMVNAAENALRDAPRDTAVHILTTAPRTLPPDPAGRLSRQEAIARIKSFEPAAWTTDRADALARLKAVGLSWSKTLFITDGLEDEGLNAFAAELAGQSELSVRTFLPRAAFAITGLAAEPDGARVTVRRAGDLLAAADVPVSARMPDSTPVASALARFAAGKAEAEAVFALPTAALNRVGLFAITGVDSAGAVWLWDNTAKRRRVGLVSSRSLAQPLLEDVYYVRKALEPFAEVTEGGLEDLIPTDPDAIILTDTGPLDPTVRAMLETWVEAGGALIRFAGPRLAAQDGGALVPVPLRASSRAFGGALNWEEPQGLDAFPVTSPFAGLSVPASVRVRQQVLAQPAPDLETYTWARLTDGSPVVTAAARGEGMLILFHITAGPDWSDLPYTGTFVDMLRRAVAAGRGRPVAGESEGLYAPQSLLTGSGRLAVPGPDARPLPGAAFFSTALGPAHPPGLYEGPAGVRARNAAAGLEPVAATDWPAGTVLLGDSAPRNRPLAGPLLAAALILLIADLLLALLLAGRLRLSGRRRSLAHAGLGLLVLLGAGLALPLPNAPAHAQQVVRTTTSKAEDAARALRLAYIETGDTALDALTQAGLEGLTQTLWRRTSVEPAAPHGVDPETDVLEMYPLLYFAVPDGAPPLSAMAMARINAYLDTGGVLIVDSRLGGTPNADGTRPLEGLLPGLDIAGMVPLPEEHVLGRTFYLLDAFPGRYAGGRVWIESASPGAVSRVIVGAADWAAAWAVDNRGRPLKTVDGGDTQRETARRVGVNLVMYALTGTYKDDQVHVPELLERLGREDGSLPGGSIQDGGETGRPE